MAAELPILSPAALRAPLSRRPAVSAPLAGLSASKLPRSRRNEYRKALLATVQFRTSRMSPGPELAWQPVDGVSPVAQAPERPVQVFRQLLA